MESDIIKAECDYNKLLPASRLTTSPGNDLRMAARVWSEIVWGEALQAGPLLLSKDQVNAGLKLVHHPVFICGAHRSGTTLVRDLLDSHPQLVVLPSEGTYYTNLEYNILRLKGKDQLAFLAKEWLRRLANPINQPPYWLLGRTTGGRSPYVDFARYLQSWWRLLDHTKNKSTPHLAVILAYASCTNALDAKLWIDKTPTNERFIKRIMQDFPEAKIIHLLRNPESVFASRKRSDPSFNMRYVMKDIKASFKIALQLSTSNDPWYLLLRYEKLCEMPADNITQLAQFLDIPVLSILFETTVSGLSTSANSSFVNDLASGKIHKWNRSTKEKLLIAEETQLLSVYMGRLATRLDYPLKMPGFFKRKYLQLKYLSYFIRDFL